MDEYLQTLTDRMDTPRPDKVEKLLRDIAVQERDDLVTQCELWSSLVEEKKKEQAKLLQENADMNIELAKKEKEAAAENGDGKKKKKKKDKRGGDEGMEECGMMEECEEPKKKKKKNKRKIEEDAVMEIGEENDQCGEPKKKKKNKRKIEEDTDIEFIDGPETENANVGDLQNWLQDNQLRALRGLAEEEDRKTKTASGDGAAASKKVTMAEGKTVASGGAASGGRLAGDAFEKALAAGDVKKQQADKKQQGTVKKSNDVDNKEKRVDKNGFPKYDNYATNQNQNKKANGVEKEKGSDKDKKLGETARKVLTKKTAQELKMENAYAGLTSADYWLRAELDNKSVGMLHLHDKIPNAAATIKVTDATAQIDVQACVEVHPKSGEVIVVIQKSGSGAGKQETRMYLPLNIFHALKDGYKAKFQHPLDMWIQKEREESKKK